MVWRSFSVEIRPHCTIPTDVNIRDSTTPRASTDPPSLHPPIFAIIFGVGLPLTNVYEWLLDGEAGDESVMRSLLEPITPSE